MQWKKIPDGYQFKVYFKYAGDSSNLVVHTIHCALDNMPLFNKIHKVLTYLSAGIEKHMNGSTEDVATHIAGRTSLLHEEIMEVILSLVFSDLKFEQNIAQVHAIEVYRYEEDSVEKAEVEMYY